MTITAGRALGVSTTSDQIDTLLHVGSYAGFYGTAPIAKQTLTQQTSTKTSTQLRAELTALQNALVALGLITVT